MSHDPWDAPASTTPPVSGAAPTPASTPRPAHDDAARFDESHELGAGAGGRIVRAVDRHLARDVALKIADGSRPEAVARLRREAAVLAALEHPGIVTLYDVAERPDGGLQLALRIVRGRTLEAELAATPPTSDATRRRLESLLAAADALAHAHAHGVVHRDLKPANIMIGAFGETQVIDWGLACRLDADDPPAGDAAAAPEGDPLRTRPGAVLGTPRYMSPEQARGARVDRRADVWALGVMIYEIVMGRPAFPHAASDEVVQAVRGGDAPDLPLASAVVDRALLDVYRRATAPLDGRFPDARAFRDALARALARRSRRRARALSAVGLGAAAALMVALTGPAEAPAPRVPPTTSAPATTDAVDLARARAVEAQRLLVDGRIPEAARLAATSLEVAATPEALGVLAATSPADAPTLLADAPLPDACGGLDLSPDGARWLCHDERGVAVHAATGVRWRIDGAFRAARFVGDHVALVERGADVDAPLRVSVRAPDGSLAVPARALACQALPAPALGAPGLVVHGRLCLDVITADGVHHVGTPREQIQAAGMGHDGRVLIVMRSGDVHEVVVGPSASESPPSRSWRTRVERASEVAVVRPVADGRLVVGTVHGEVRVLADDAPARSLRTTLGAITRLAASPSGDHVAAMGDRDGADIIDLRAMRIRAHVPVRDLAALVLVDDVRLATLADRHVAWSLPRVRPTELVGYRGIVSLATDGEGLALAFGDEVAWVDLADGLERGRLVAREPLKSVALGPDGTLAVVGIGRDSLARVVPPALDPMPDPALAGPGARRVAFTRGGALLVARYTPETLAATAPRSPPEPILSEEAIDLATSGDRVALLTEGGAFVLMALSPAPLELTRCPAPAARAVALAPDGERALIGGGHEVAVVDPNDCTLVARHTLPEGTLSELAASPDGAHVAAGTREGLVYVWHVGGALTLSLPAHREMLSSLAFDPRGRFLVTGSWDGHARLLDMTLLARDPASIIADVRAAWGR